MSVCVWVCVCVCVGSMVSKRSQKPEYAPLSYLRCRRGEGDDKAQDSGHVSAEGGGGSLGWGRQTGEPSRHLETVTTSVAVVAQVNECVKAWAGTYG